MLIYSALTPFYLSFRKKLSLAINYYSHNHEFEDEIQIMYHASSKIAFLSIKNSIKVGYSLLQILPEDEDFIFSVLLQLQQINHQIKAKFPLNHQFKRVGFDDLYQ